jgi:multiple sugar transport system substrate-binding protein
MKEVHLFMKKASKVIALLVALCVGMGLVLTGCGAAQTTESKATAASQNAAVTEPAPAETEAKEPVTLKFTYWGSPDEKKAIEGACAKFTEKYPWIKVEAVQIPNSDYNAKLTAMSAGNDIPDTGYMTGDLGDTWANEGKFANLFDMFAKDTELKKEDFLDYIWYKLTPDNAWGISTAGECFGLYYNKDLVKAAGVDKLPTTAETAMSWDEFVDLAKKLTLDKNGKTAADPGFDPKNIKQYGFMFETWDQPINNFIYSNGGAWTSEDGKDFALNSPEAADAIQKLADLINVYHVAPSPLAAKSLPAMATALQSNLTAMCLGGQWINLDLGNAKANYDIGVLPVMKKSITIGLSGATVFFKESKHPEEGWQLFKWMSDPAGAIELYSGGLWMPTLKKWYTDPDLVSKWVDANPAAHPAGFKEAMMDQLMKNGVPQPQYYLKNYAKLAPIVTSSWDQVWLGKKTAAEALAEMEPKAKAEYKGRYDR